MAEVGSMVKVSGSRIATPFGPPRPGSTPTKMPSTSPTIISSSVFQVSRTAKPCTSRPKASINVKSCDLLATEAASSGPFGMMTSKAMSKVTNITAVNTKAVSSDFHSAILPTIRMKTGDQEEACDIEPEELRGEAEQQRRHEHRHDAAKLRPRHEGLGSLLARQESGDQAIEAGAAEDHGEIERKIAGLRTGRIPRPAPVRQLSQPSVSASASSSSDTTTSTTRVLVTAGEFGLRRGRVVDDDFDIGIGHEMRSIRLADVDEWDTVLALPASM